MEAKNKRKPRPLTLKEVKFIKNIKQGKNQTESAILAGYSQNSAGVIASQLMGKEPIKRALERAGLTDDTIAESLKRHIEDGIGIKPSADTSLRAIELVTRLKGQLDKEGITSLNQVNNYNLQALDATELQQKLQQLTEEIQAITPIDDNKTAS